MILIGKQKRIPLHAKNNFMNFQSTTLIGKKYF